jgi:hypothetical protein
VNRPITVSVKRKKKPAQRKKTEQAPLDETWKRSMDDMRWFHRITDWEALWNDFYLSIDRAGNPKHATLAAFIQTVAKSPTQRVFLTWYLGPKPRMVETDPQLLKFGQITEPVDWMRKRDTGGWFCEETVTKFTAEITRKVNALEAMREAGNHFTVRSMARFESLANQLDKDMRGCMMQPGLTLKEQEARAEVYLRLHERLLSLQGTAQELYAKAHGVDFRDLSGLMTLMQAAALNQQQVDDMGSGPSLVPGHRKTATAILGNVIEMAMVKADKYKYKQPDLIDEAIEAEVTSTKKSKDGVQ